jgi:hypothetical protein
MVSGPIGVWDHTLEVIAPVNTGLIPSSDWRTWALRSHNFISEVTLRMICPEEYESYSAKHCLVRMVSIIQNLCPTKGTLAHSSLSLSLSLSVLYSDVLAFKFWTLYKTLHSVLLSAFELGGHLSIQSHIWNLYFYQCLAYETWQGPLPLSQF